MCPNGAEEVKQAPSFEGSEKRLEIDFSLRPNDRVGLRAIPRADLDSFLDLAACTIVSVRNSEVSSLRRPWGGAGDRQPLLPIFQGRLVSRTTHRSDPPTPPQHFDAYVLSESSLFVYPTKLVLKTCGTTKLLNAVGR